MDNRSICNSKILKDKSKLQIFKEKVQLLKREESMDEYEQLKILQDALKVLNITEEPIDKYYYIGDVIGSGKYGLVRQGVSTRNPDHFVAIKTINLTKLTTKYHILAQEILTLKRVNHPNIVKMYEFYRDLDKLHLVMEYVEGKELFDFIFQRNKLKESEASNIIKQLLLALNHLNSLNIMHRDLKLENIVINPMTFQVKVIDFGFSCYYDSKEKLHTRVGTPYYIAPEVL
jgi:serine/threonine protein kinase